MTRSTPTDSRIEAYRRIQKKAIFESAFYLCLSAAIVSLVLIYEAVGLLSFVALAGALLAGLMFCIDLGAGAYASIKIKTLSREIRQ